MKANRNSTDEIVQIEAFFTTGNNNKDLFYHMIYCELQALSTSNGKIVKFMQDINELIGICVNGNATPLQTSQTIEKEIGAFDIDIYYKLLTYEFLLKFLKDNEPADEYKNNVSIMMKTLRDKQMELNNHSRFKSMFNFAEVKEHLEKIPDTKNQIEFLIKTKTDYQQYMAGREKKEPRWDWELDWDRIIDKAFAEKCDLEINKLKETLALPNTASSQPLTAPFTLNKALTRIDYIRIINALSELRCFKKQDEILPTKKDVMQAFGNLVNIDLSNYDKDLNKALTSNVSLEKNIEIFEKMKEKTAEIFNKKLDNPQQ